MNASAGMMAPSLIVLGVVGWACWSHLDVAEPPAPAKVKFEPLPAGQPSLDLRIAGARNPFLLPSRVAAVKAAAASKGAKSTSWEDWMKQLTQAIKQQEVALQLRKAASEAWLKQLIRAFNRPRANQAKAAEDQHAKARTTLKALALGGTSVGGDRKVAILAGRAYAEGDAIEGIDRALGPVVLSEVRATEVILNCPAGLVTVTFPDASKPSTAPNGSRAPMVAMKRPSRARTKSTTPTMRGKAH